MAGFVGIADNTVGDIPARYAAILGLSPSKGARSPLLWNAAYAAAGSAARMLPLDVTEARLPEMVAALRADSGYIGGSVAVPHKQTIAGLLDRLEPEAERIGAVNAIWRDGTALVGSNTDGAGALSQVADALPDLAGRQALLIGLGGAGMAVAAYLAGAVAGLTLVNRSPDKAAAFADRLGAGVRTAPWPASPEILATTDLLVNCTSVGYEGGASGMPISDAALAALPPAAFVYDIVYQPAETSLLAAAAARGLGTRNGLGMNMDQAVIAFERANPGLLDREAIRAAMRAA